MPTPRWWTEERLVEAVRTFLHREGRPPHRLEFAKRGGVPDRRLVERRMRSCQVALRLAQAPRLAALEETESCERIAPRRA